jgi:hypothetical protein
MKTNLHALSVIRTRDPNIQASKTHALERAATEILAQSLNTNEKKIKTEI